MVGRAWTELSPVSGTFPLPRSADFIKEKKMVIAFQLRCQCKNGEAVLEVRVQKGGNVFLKGLLESKCIHCNTMLYLDMPDRSGVPLALGVEEKDLKKVPIDPKTGNYSEEDLLKI